MTINALRHWVVELSACVHGRDAAWLLLLRGPHLLYRTLHVQQHSGHIRVRVANFAANVNKRAPSNEPPSRLLCSPYIVRP